MYQGNWTCSGCGRAITELPFEPRRTDGLLCRDCHQKQKGSGQGRGAGKDAPRGNNANRSDRQMFKGDWHCSDCQAVIAELPFEPRNTSNLKCKNCFQKTR